MLHFEGYAKILSGFISISTYFEIAGAKVIN